MRYYSAAASALDPVLAKEVLALMLTDELANNRVSGIILRVGVEHPDMVWNFVKENHGALADKIGSTFRGYFYSNLMGNFNDRAHAEEIKAFTPLNDTSGGRQVAERISERLMANAEFVDQQLPAIDAWIGHRTVLP